MALDKNAITKEAQKFTAKGQFDKAIAEWKKLLKETPGDPNIYNTIGDLCLKKDAKADAVDAYMRAADLLADDGFTSKAIALYKKIINIDPKKIEVHLALGNLNAEKGLTGNALESYKVAADHYQKNKEMGKALGIYQKMADLNPSNAAFRTKLADMYVKEGMKKEAVQAYLAAATVHIGGNQFNEARHLFEKVLSVDPNNKTVYQKAGVVYFKEGKFAEACKAFKPAFESDPANQELAELYLEALTKAGREQDAAEIYEKILEKDPSRTDLREKLFRIHLAKRDSDKALQEARKLAEEQIKKLLAAATEQGQKLLPGTVLPGAEQETDAERALKAFIQENPEYADARRVLSEFYEKVGRREDAARELVKAAEILGSSGNRDGARDYLNRALEIWPGLDEAKRQLDQLEAAAAAPPPPEAPATAAPGEDPKIVEGLTESDVLIKYGLVAKALEQLEGLAARFPESLKVRLRLRDLYRESGDAEKAAAHVLLAADLCSRAGQQEQAESLIREALELDPKNSEVLSRLGMTPPAPEEAPAPQEIAVEIPAVEAPAASPAPASAQPATPEEAPTVSPEFGEALTFETPDLAGVQPTAAPKVAPPATTDAVPEPEAPVIEMPQPVIPEPEEKIVELGASPTPEEAPSRELAAETAGGEAIDINEIWAEAEFYYQQGLFDEARKKYEKILLQKPDDPRTLKRIDEISRQKEEVQEFTSLAEAVEGLERFVPEGEIAAGELAASASDEEAVRSLMQDIQSMKQREREEQERREREAREHEEQEAGLRIEQERNKEAQERRERAEQEDRLRIEQEAREKAEQELRELRQRLEQEVREREEREREAAVASAAAVGENQPAFDASGPGRPEEDFSALGEEIRRKVAPGPGGFAREEDFSGQAPAASPTGALRVSGGEQSEDFFDLAAELRDELGSASLPQHAGGLADEQSLDEIFEDFKRGMEQQTGEQDANTHYNLGIAYKEMGLLDDAVAEFLLTSEGESRFVESRYMLGLCYMEQGDYHKAIAEVHNALNYAVSFGGSDEERISMLYDLGLAYQGAGNINDAIGTFQQVAEMIPGYRDVDEKLKELRTGEFVSMDQLKEDIEKEISSKFFEEGERIEREEKTRKAIK